ncbi:MAG: 4-hydroxy-tetrahydrodipicolinate reductase, partial [Gaiellaceae bacterium]
MVTEDVSVCIAGATGWTGRALVRAVLEAPDLELASAVSRSAAGQDLGETLGGDALGIPVYANVREALPGANVLVDYTSETVVKANT